LQTDPAAGAGAQYHVPKALRLEADARMPAGIQKLFTHKYTLLDQERGIIEEHSLVMKRMTRAGRAGLWEIERLAQTHSLDGTSDIEPKIEPLYGDLDCLDALRYLSQFERGQEARGAKVAQPGLNHYADAAREASIAFDLEGNPHPLVDGNIVTQGYFEVDRLREEGIFVSNICETEPLRDVMGEEAEARRYDYILTRKNLLGQLQILMPLLVALRDRFDEAFRGGFSESSRNAFQRAAASCRESVDKRMLGFASDRQALLNYVGSLEVLADVLETKQMFRALDAMNGQQLLNAVDQVRRRVEKQQQDMAAIGYSPAQQKKLLAYIIDGADVRYPNSVNAMLLDFRAACEALEESCRVAPEARPAPARGPVPG
jgi:hypothetical protein